MKIPSAFLVPAVGMMVLAEAQSLDPLPENAEELAAILKSTAFSAHLRETVSIRRSALGANEEGERNVGEEKVILNCLSALLPASSLSETARTRANAFVYRVLVRLEEGEEVRKLPPPNVIFRNVVWGSLFGHGIPLVPEDRRDVPIGLDAENESIFLCDSDSTSLLSVEELALLSPVEISRLDIAPGHPFWLSHGELKEQGDQRPDRFRSGIESLVTGRLRAEGRLPSGGVYDCDVAKRVLFLDKVEQSATSPKVEAEDAFGVEWKVKWGDEVAVEPVSSRLYLFAGGRETDLVFSNGFGRDGVTLILEEKGSGDGEESESERHASTREELEEVLQELYGFDLGPYIHESGVITPANVGEVLRQLPKHGKSKYRPKELIGREWLTFRESGAELKPDKVVLRLDGGAIEDPITANDRGYRALYLFDLWIQNGDAKEENNKIYFRRGGPEGGATTIHSIAEGHHDLGYSLGGLFSSGTTNFLHTGTEFAREGSRKLRFKGPLIFKPKVWTRATWADGKWMARHIAAISVEEISEAVAASEWPDFVQESLVYRLTNRRDAIAHLFGEADSLEGKAGLPPTRSYLLNSPDEILRVESHFQLPVGSIAQAIGEIGLPKGGRDTVVVEGMLASCKVSPIVRALVHHRYPSGFTERYRRGSDKPPPCD